MQNASPKPDCIYQLEQIKARLLLRAGLISSIRQYFDTDGFNEVESPLMSKAPAQE